MAVFFALEVLELVEMLWWYDFWCGSIKVIFVVVVVW